MCGSRRLTLTAVIGALLAVGCGARSEIDADPTPAGTGAFGSTSSGQGSGGSGGACFGEGLPCLVESDCCKGTCLGNTCRLSPCAADVGPVVVAEGLGTINTMVEEGPWLFATDFSAGTVVRIPKAGGVREVLLVAPYPMGIALSGAELLVTLESTVVRLPKSGGVPSVIADGQGFPGAVAASEGFAYWTSYTDGRVLRAPLPDGPVELLATVDASPYRLTLTPSHVYWGGLGQVVRAVPRGGGAVYEYPDLIGEELSFQAGRVLVTDSLHQRLVALPEDGSGVAETLVDLSPYGDFPLGLAVDETHAYVTLAASGGVVRVDGQTGGVEVLAQGTAHPGAIAVDESCVYWISTINNGEPVSTLWRSRKEGG